MRIRAAFFSCSSIVCLGMATLVFAIPGTTACAFVGAREFESLSDKTLIEPQSSSRDRAKIQELLSAARERIGTTFGPPQAKPIVVFLQNAEAFWPLSLNAHGSTNFVGDRACVIVGPKGQSVDVVAHELMHAELADRVGYWRRLIEIPTWFDEGVAMQVDYRPRYDLPSGMPVKTNYVRNLETAHAFFKSSGSELVHNYASAKYEVAHWLSGIGRQNFYQRLEHIQNGEKFDTVLAD